MWVKVGDTVEVTAGDDRGTKAKVKGIDHEVGKATVEGVNRVYKHVRKSQRNPQGGRLSMEMPVQLANLAVVCTKCGKASRMGARYLADGSKERYCKKCDGSNGEISPAKARYAKKA
jgi:large subunit ribosomal protein L24